MTHTAVEEIITRMAAAELASDHTALEELIAEDFRLVGPLGFVLDKPEGLEQYRAGRLSYSRVAITDPAARTYDDITVVIAIREQEATYQGRPANGRFRTTLIVSTADERPRIVGMHLSPIAVPPAPKPPS
jgi:hypothetical protein